MQIYSYIYGSAKLISIILSLTLHAYVLFSMLDLETSQQSF